MNKKETTQKLSKLGLIHRTLRLHNLSRHNTAIKLLQELILRCDENTGLVSSVSRNRTREQLNLSKDGYTKSIKKLIELGYISLNSDYTRGHTARTFKIEASVIESKYYKRDSIDDCTESSPVSGQVVEVSHASAPANPPAAPAVKVEDKAIMSRTRQDEATKMLDAEVF